MIQRIAHREPGADPAGTGLAPTVASAPHAPSGRAPEAPVGTAGRGSRPAPARHRGTGPTSPPAAR